MVMPGDAAVITLSVPAEAVYARAVRMTAANLAVVCGMNVDAVEDVRMAAGEGFVYACATAPGQCDVSFTVSADGMRMGFALGAATPDDTQLADIDLIELMLDALCDDFGISDDGTSLCLVKRTDATNAE